LSSTNYLMKTEKELRTFGLTVGSVFTLIGFWPMVVRGDVPRFWALILAGILVGLAALLPKSLALPYHLWIKLGAILGWINTRILLSLCFFGLFTPLGWGLRLAGKDPMRRKFDRECRTYRVLRLSRKPSYHMEKQF